MYLITAGSSWYEIAAAISAPSVFLNLRISGLSDWHSRLLKTQIAVSILESTLLTCMTPFVFLLEFTGNRAKLDFLDRKDIS